MKANAITRSFGRAVLQTKKNSPHIFFGLGLAGVVGGTVLACKATLKLEETLDEIKSDVNVVKEGHESGVRTQQETNQVMGAVYIRGGLKLAKLYGPAIIVGGLGIAALSGSHIQLTRRNAALQAALVAVTKAYEDYRAKVREEIGEERENQLYRNLDEIAASDNPNQGAVGKYSPYARIFDEYNPNWKKEAELNRVFLLLQQNFCNYKLSSKGHLFLNEVYDALGMERSRIGSVVGWVYNGEGDDFVDFGLYSPDADAFNEGWEPNVWLDFNVDGVIFDKI